MTPDQEERLVSAFERIAEALDFTAGSVAAISKTVEKTHAKTFPRKKKPIEATITHVLSEEERLKEEQGASDEPLEKWTKLGAREEEWLREHPEERDSYPDGPSVEGEDEG